LLANKLPAGLLRKELAGHFTKLELPYLDRCSEMGVLAARQATTDAELEQFAGYGQRAGLYFGPVGGGVKVEHDWVRQFYVEHKQLAKPYSIMACMLNAAAAQISIRHQILGPVMTHSSDRCKILAGLRHGKNFASRTRKHWVAMIRTGQKPRHGRRAGRCGGGDTGEIAPC
jgi:hypothetical protein